MVIDGIIQYACAVDQKEIPGAEGIAFEGSNGNDDVPPGLLPNLGRAVARNYCLDLVYGLPLRRVFDSGFLTKRQDVGIIQWAGAYPGRLHPSHRSERVEG